MIDIPDNVHNGVFNKEFKRGSVIKTKCRFQDGTERFKYFITLNSDVMQGTAVFVLTTSQTKFYNKHPYFNKDIVRLPAKKIKVFSKETIIDCREIYKLSKQVLKKNFSDGTLKFVGVLPADILQNIDSIISQSFFISPHDKKLILGK